MVYLTIPVTIASGERFSELIDTNLSTISQERLNKLAMVSMENGIVKIVDLENIFRLFIKSQKSLFSKRPVYKHYICNCYT